MKRFYLLSFLVIHIYFFSSNLPKPIAPLHVKIVSSSNAFHLLVNEKPYFVKGAGGTTYLKRLKQCGGNSIRTWSTTGVEVILDSAYMLGLTVTLGLEMALERQGFHYTDQVFVEKQFEKLKKEIIKYKDHPALLFWGIGNELELLNSRYEVWDAVEKIAAYIHSVDSHHPVTTMLAGVPLLHIREIKKRCPSLDFISINAFMDLPNVHNKLKKAGWSLPYLITEWGSDGYWESVTTSWGSFLEPTSTKKAELIRARYRTAVLKHQNVCLGSYVFYWGAKQERTHTVFSFFNENGAENEMVELMEELWSNRVPTSRAPKIKPIGIDQLSGVSGITLLPGSIHHAFTDAWDENKDPLFFQWEIYYESNETKEGGDREERPPNLNYLFLQSDSRQAIFNAPLQEGKYRMFVSVYDNQNKVAQANMPFLVRRAKNN